MSRSVVRPRQPVDHEREARLEREELDAGIVGGGQVLQLRPVQAGPVGDHQYAVVRRCAGRIDDEGARELCVFGGAKRQRHPGCRRPVVIGARTSGREADLTLGRRRDLERRARAAVARAQPVHPKRVRKIVAHARDDLRPFGHTNQRRRDLQRPAELAERLDLERRTVRSLGAPQTARRAQLERQHVALAGAGGLAVVVGGNRRQAIDRMELMCRRGVEPGAEQEGQGK